MKYMYTNPQIKTLTNNISTKVIGYFFHERGIKHETEFRSLLASILKYLLGSFPDATNSCLLLFRDLRDHHGGQLEGSSWNEDELKEALNMIKNAIVSGTVLLLIDGLDECSGNHRTQLDFLVEWVQSTQGKDFTIRMCLASQALPEFRSRLSNFPKCEIHEWTAGDSAEYVHDKLGHAWNAQHPDARGRYKQLDHKYLTHQIQKKANGVFLWVEIVVETLGNSIEEECDVTQLRKCLDNLPSGLEELYQRIIEQIPMVCLEQAKEYVALILANGSTGLLELYLATEQSDEVSKWMEQPFRKIIGSFVKPAIQ